MYPGHPWQPWAFERRRSVHLRGSDEDRYYVEWLGKKLNVKELGDWYGVPVGSLVELGAGHFLQIRYNSSLFEALKAVYPTHVWEEWRFQPGPRREETIG